MCNQEWNFSSPATASWEASGRSGTVRCVADLLTHTICSLPFPGYVAGSKTFPPSGNVSSNLYVELILSVAGQTVDDLVTNPIV